MDAVEFRESLLAHVDAFHKALGTETGEWVVKGFIDVYKNIYTISVDTKVVSKIVELMLFPLLSQFAKDLGYNMILSEYQNHYPDITFVQRDGTKIALDVKSTYRTGPETVNGLTLGAFTGYFRDRHSNKNITFP
jgi:Restriction endonuclease EcoRV